MTASRADNNSPKAHGCRRNAYLAGTSPITERSGSLGQIHALTAQHSREVSRTTAQPTPSQRDLSSVMGTSSALDSRHGAEIWSRLFPFSATIRHHHHCWKSWKYSRNIVEPRATIGQVSKVHGTRINGPGPLNPRHLKRYRVPGPVAVDDCGRDLFNYGVGITA